MQNITKTRTKTVTFSFKVTTINVNYKILFLTVTVGNSFCYNQLSFQLNAKLLKKRTSGVTRLHTGK